ncbi:MAG: ATP-binding protein [Rubripirellula sp.]
MSDVPMIQWSEVIGHAQLHDWFSAAIDRGRLGGSLLFVGAPGTGKRTVANLLARTLLCQKVPAIEMAPCGVCPACLQVEAGTHPDVVRVSKPADKSNIPLELLIGPKDARMQEGFCRDIRIKPMEGDRKVAILEDADFLAEEGANCLLKTLEEPPAGAIIILIGTVEQRQLPTIRSRCQIIRFGLSDQDATRLLREVHKIEASDDEIQSAIDVSGGDMHAALRLLADDTDGFRQDFIRELQTDYPSPVVLRRILTSHVDAAGKEASKRRNVMRDAFSMSVQLFRGRLRQEALDDRSSPLTLARLDRSIRALREVDRSANQSTLIECFAADIAGGTTGDRGGIG